VASAIFCGPTGRIFWLNVACGTLTEVAESESSFKNSLEQSAKRELWFAEQQMERLAENGLKPNDLQCIGFKTPVVFAESANVPDNAYVADLYKCRSAGICIGRLPKFLMAGRSGSRWANHQPARSNCKTAP
jgi:hypothetical protein